MTVIINKNEEQKYQQKLFIHIVAFTCDNCKHREL